MKNANERKKIVKELLDLTDREFTDEELIHELISTKVTKNSEQREKLSLGQRASDAVAKFAGSWAFIFSFISVYTSESCAVVYCRGAGSSYYDEPESAGGEGQGTRRKRL